MDRRVQIVDELRTDGGLRHHESNRRTRITRVPLDDPSHVSMGIGRLQPVHYASHLVHESTERSVGPGQVLSQFSTRGTAAVTG